MDKAIIDEPMNNIHNNIFGPRGPHAKNAAPHRYVAEMNGALERSQIPIEYKQWGSVQMIPQTHAEMVSGVSCLFRCLSVTFCKTSSKGTNDENPNEKFINALGDSEEKRKELKQTADHIVLLLNDYPGPFRW